MAYDLSKNKNQTAIAVVNLGGEKISTEYYRAKATAAWYRSFGEEPLAHKLAEVIKGWDITDGGKAVQPHADALKADPVAAWREVLLDIPQEIIRTVINQILEDLNPSKDTVKN